MDMSLPEMCAVRNLETGKAVLVKRGESGYYTFVNEINPNAYNEARGVTPAQREAMHIGSCFGWDVPGAYAKRHTDAPRTV